MPKLISFFGKLGSGKTTRAKLLAGFLGVPLYSEKADSPFLEDMFLKKSNALLNQLHFLYRNRNEIIEKYKHSKQDVVVFDYNIAQVDIFSDYFLNPYEYQEFSKHFQNVLDQLPTPDLVIYLHIDPALNLSRIKNRKRSYEKVNKKFIIATQNKQYEHLVRLKKRTRVLELDSSMDVVNSIENRLKALKKMISNLPPCIGCLDSEAR